MPVVVPPSWAPTPEQVHALVPTRPAFTETSRPSVLEVQSLIGLAVDSIATEAPAEVLDLFAGKVRFAVTLNVAAMVELGSDPEQQQGTDAVATQLWARYQGELIGLRALFARAALGTATGGAFSVSLWDESRAPRSRLDPWPVF